MKFELMLTRCTKAYSL